MFGPKLDSLTLLLSISALGFVMAAISRSAAKALPTYRLALAAWSKAMFAAGIAFFLFHTRGHLPWVLSFSLGNALVMLVAAYGLVAHCKLLDVGIPKWIFVGTVSIGLFGLISIELFGAPYVLGVSTVSATLAVFFGITAILLTREVQDRPQLTTVVAAVVLWAISTALVLRVYISSSGDAASVVPTSPAAPQVGLFLLGIVYILTTSLWIFETVHERQARATLDAAKRDGLTGIYTRTAFFEFASNLIGKQSSGSCAVVMVDIDHFKAINDTMGHAAGDSTIAHAARLIVGAVRLTDVVGRYGGEEFCLMLPNCTGEHAAELAERLVADAARQTVRHSDGRTLRYTLSAGYAALDMPGILVDPTATLSAMLDRADQALYRAKNEGRNRAVAAQTVFSDAGTASA